MSVSDFLSVFVATYFFLYPYTCQFLKGVLVGFEGPYEVGLSRERDIAKLAENLGASPVQKDILIDTTFLLLSAKSISLDSPSKLSH
jgi:hypothetical protein